MKKNNTLIRLLTTAFLLIELFFISNALATETVNIGILAYRPKAEMLKHWQPFAEKLSHEIPNIDFRIAAYNFDEIEQAVAARRIDFVITNPSNYILLKDRYGLSAPMATILSDNFGAPLNVFGGTIFCLRNRDDIKSLSDLNGKKIAATAKTSLGGYQTQAKTLLDAGLSQTDFTLVQTGMPHDTVITTILNGGADAGFVRTGVLEALIQQRLINLSDIKIINAQPLPHFPFLVSTPLYPEWPVAALPHLYEDITRKVVSTLFQMEGDEALMKTMGLHGFDIPADYTVVEQLLRDLNLPPYDIEHDIHIRDIWDHYPVQLTGAIAFTIITLLLSGFLFVSRQVLQTQHKQLEQSEFRWKFAIEGAGDALWDLDITSGKVDYSPTWYKVCGHNADDAHNTLSAWRDRIHPDDVHEAIQAMENYIAGHAPNYEHEYRMHCTDGDYRWVLDRGVIVERASDNSPLRMIGTHRDISKNKAAESDFRLSRRVFENTQEGIMITDAHSRIIDVNQALCDITNFSREDIIGKNPSILNSGKQDASFYGDMWHKIQNDGYWQGEVWNRKKTGEIYAEFLTISTIHDDHGQLTNYVGIFTDITTVKAQQRSLERIAHYDPLTHLPNRVLFTDRLQQAIAHAERTNTLLAICFLDLDHFKEINDKFGHDVGDQVLVEVANRIKKNMRDEDTASRHGGDEFTLLLGQLTSYTDAEKLLKRLLSGIAEPYQIDDQTHYLTGSIGVTFYPTDKSDADVLVRHADHAMYQAKLVGRDQYQIYKEEDDQQLQKLRNRLEEIKVALTDKQFQLFYQPKVNMASGEVYGAEALIRWIHPIKGIIPPLEFLPYLEGTELEVEVGNWVIEQALRQQDEWLKQGLELEVSVNVSSYHLQSSTFFINLDEMLARYPNVNSNKLQLEILESSTLGDVDDIVNVIKTCRDALGVRIALDDFGTGYSSLTHLRNIPCNTIKIDQSFVRDLLDDPHDYSIVDGVIALCNSFGREVIAEGVETTEHGLMLLLMGCYEAQGYGISKPMPADEIKPWLDRYQPNQQWIKAAATNRTKQQDKIEQLKLGVDRYKSVFERNINSSPESISHWPIADKSKCLCGRWLSQAKQANILDDAAIQELDTAHEQMHIIAHALLMKYQDKHIDEARAGLSEFAESYEQMNAALKHSSENTLH